MVFAPLMSVLSWFNLHSQPVSSMNRNRHLFTSPISSLNQNLGQQQGQHLDGVVTIDILPSCQGQVKFAGGWWSAKCSQARTLTKGTLVSVIGRDNITLIVEPLAPLLEQQRESMPSQLKYP